jgi:hypothetical protein
VSGPYWCGICRTEIVDEDPHTDAITGDDVHEACCRECHGPRFEEFPDLNLPPPPGYGWTDGDETVVAITQMRVYLRVNLTTGVAYEARVVTPMAVDPRGWEVLTADHRFEADERGRDLAMEILDRQAIWPAPGWES